MSKLDIAAAMLAVAAIGVMVNLTYEKRTENQWCQAQGFDNGYATTTGMVCFRTEKKEFKK